MCRCSRWAEPSAREPQSDRLFDLASREARLPLGSRLGARAVLRARPVPRPLHLRGRGPSGDLLGLLHRVDLLLARPAVLLCGFRGLLRGPSTLALLAPALHLRHRGALVVQAELPGPTAPGDDLETRRLPADRADLLELVEALDPLGQREGLVTGIRRVGVVPVPALAADEALARLSRLDDPQHVGRAVRLGAASLLADDAG